MKLLMNNNGSEINYSESIYVWYSHIGHLVPMCSCDSVVEHALAAQKGLYICIPVCSVSRFG